MSVMSLGTLGRALLAEATATTSSTENATAVAFCDAEHPTLSHRINNPGAERILVTSSSAHAACKHINNDASLNCAPPTCANSPLAFSECCHKGASCGPDDYNWCAVPHRPWDTLLFAGIAVVIACLSQGPYSSLIVLVAGESWMVEQSTLLQECYAKRPWPRQLLSRIGQGAAMCGRMSECPTTPRMECHAASSWPRASHEPEHTSSVVGHQCLPCSMLSAGGALMGFVYPFNLREIGNGVALWLGIEPYELFFYIFLPPLLLDAALKIDWYIFKKVRTTGRPSTSPPSSCTCSDRDTAATALQGCSSLWELYRCGRPISQYRACH